MISLNTDGKILPTLQGELAQSVCASFRFIDGVSGSDCQVEEEVGDEADDGAGDAGVAPSRKAGSIGRYFGYTLLHHSVGEHIPIGGGDEEGR